MVRGAALSYLALMVVLPLAALSVRAAEPGVSAFWKALTNPFAWHALKLSFATALVMAAINAVMGTATAWVLVRYSFPGKGVMNALIANIFPVLAATSGGAPFVFFAVMMLVQFFVVLSFYPETKGYSLEEMQKKLGMA